LEHLFGFRIQRQSKGKWAPRRLSSSRIRIPGGVQLLLRFGFFPVFTCVLPLSDFHEFNEVVFHRPAASPLLENQLPQRKRSPQ